MTAYRNISAYLHDGSYELAKCNSDLMASAMLDSLRSCVSDSNCRKSIESNILKSAPEVINQTPLPFDYIYSDDGKKQCNKSKAPTLVGE